MRKINKSENVSEAHESRKTIVTHNEVEGKEEEIRTSFIRSGTCAKLLVTNEYHANADCLLI